MSALFGNIVLTESWHSLARQPASHLKESHCQQRLGEALGTSIAWLEPDISVQISTHGWSDSRRDRKQCQSKARLLTMVWVSSEERQGLC